MTTVKVTREDGSIVTETNFVRLSRKEREAITATWFKFNAHYVVTFTN